MPLDQSFVGRVYPPTPPYQVGREKIREFADAIGDANPAYRDRAAAKELGYPDVIAPPTFGIIVTSRAGHQVIMDPELGVDYSRVVHGDALSVVVTVESVRSVAGNDIVSTKGDVSTVDGDPVLTTYSTLVVRGADS